MKVCKILSQKGYCGLRQCATLCKEAYRVLDLIKEIRAEHKLTLDEAIEYIQKHDLIKL